MSRTVPSARGNILYSNDGDGFNAYVFHVKAYEDPQNWALSYFLRDLYELDWVNNEKNVHAITSIVSLHGIPITVSNGAEVSKILIGSQEFATHGYHIHKVYNRFQHFAERVINITEHNYGNYLDYPPYTRVVLHLPFIGDREIDHTPFLQDDGNIYTHFSVDVFTGDLVCFVADHNNYVYYSFTGNCKIGYPLTGADWSRQVAGAAQAVTGAVSMIGGIVSENPMLTIGGAMGMTSGIVSAFQPPKTMVNGSITATHGYQGTWSSYATITRPTFDASYGAQGYSVKGKPCHKYVALNDLENTGFTKIAEIKMKNFPGQKSELDECLALLKEGVLL